MRGESGKHSRTPQKFSSSGAKHARSRRGLDGPLPHDRVLPGCRAGDSFVRGHAGGTRGARQLRFEQRQVFLARMNFPFEMQEHRAAMAAGRTARRRKCFFSVLETGFNLLTARVCVIRHAVSPGFFAGARASHALPPNSAIKHQACGGSTAKLFEANPGNSP